MERPILFNTSMVQAILEGRKTQTRRLVKNRLTIEQAEFENGNRPNVTLSEPSLQHYIDNDCPYGQVGDLLWVRETFMDLSGTGVEHRDSEGKLQRYAYATDCLSGSYSDELRKDFGLKWTPSIHMPRSASRILLEITNIRVERLNDISEADCLKEGVGSPILRDCKKPKFMQLWESINGADSWAVNPWVWVVEFKVKEPQQ